MDDEIGLCVQNMIPNLGATIDTMIGRLYIKKRFIFIFLKQKLQNDLVRILHINFDTDQHLSVELQVPTIGPHGFT